MRLINLTEEDLQTLPLTHYERHLLRSGLDNYAATSFSAMLDGFRTNPPVKRDPRSQAGSAFVHLGDIDARIVEEWREPPGIDVPLFGLREDLTHPVLELFDGQQTLYTTWLAGTPQDFLETRERFGLSRTQRVEVPEVTLQYHYLGRLFEEHDKGAYRVELRALREEQIAWPERQCFSERMKAYFGKITAHAPLPAFSPSPS